MSSWVDAKEPGVVQRYVPATKWLRSYRWSDWLRTDVIAGVSVAALLIPESLA